jgi:hypothetical protein
LNVILKETEIVLSTEQVHSVFMNDEILKASKIVANASSHYFLTITAKLNTVKPG